MINKILSITLVSLLTLLSSQSFAANFFSGLSEQEVQKIFDDADQSDLAFFLTNSSKKPLPAVQILPQINSPKVLIKAGTNCIKLYSCNQEICLIGVDKNKYAVNEPLLKSLVKKQVDYTYCSNSTSSVAIAATKKDIKKAPVVNSKSAAKFSWVKVIKVKSNDNLNVRKLTSYKSTKVGSLAHNAKCIKRYRCKGKWCEIKNSSTLGWVHGRFLAKMSSKAQQQCF